MDIISHGLWGSLAFGRTNKLQFLLAFLIGIAPDLFSFGLYSLLIWLGVERGVSWSGGPPPVSAIPEYVAVLYNLTHSLIIFLAVFGLVYLFTRRPIVILLAWPLHILVDIFTHSLEFFPTPRMRE